MDRDYRDADFCSIARENALLKRAIKADGVSFEVMFFLSDSGNGRIELA